MTPGQINIDHSYLEVTCHINTKDPESRNHHSCKKKRKCMEIILQNLFDLVVVKWKITVKCPKQALIDATISHCTKRWDLEGLLVWAQSAEIRCQELRIRMSMDVILKTFTL